MNGMQSIIIEGDCDGCRAVGCGSVGMLGAAKGRVAGIVEDRLISVVGDGAAGMVLDPQSRLAIRWRTRYKVPVVAEVLERLQHRGMRSANTKKK